MSEVMGMYATSAEAGERHAGETQAAPAPSINAPVAPAPYTVQGEAPKFVLKHKPATALEIEIDLNALGWGDLKKLGRLTQVDTDNDAQMDEMEALVQKVIGQRDVKTVPVPAMMAIIQEMMASLRMATGPAQKN